MKGIQGKNSSASYSIKPYWLILPKYKDRKFKDYHIKSICHSCLILSIFKWIIWWRWLLGYREIMHAMWKPQKFKYIYLFATLYVLTLTLPSASATYWAFGDQLLTHSNALSLLPRTPWRDAAVVLMLIHQVGFFFHIFLLLIHESLRWHIRWCLIRRR